VQIFANLYRIRCDVIREHRAEGVGGRTSLGSSEDIELKQVRTNETVHGRSNIAANWSERKHGRSDRM